MAAVATLLLAAIVAMVVTIMVITPMEEVATVVTSVVMAALPEATTAMAVMEALPLEVRSLDSHNKCNVVVIKQIKQK